MANNRKCLLCGTEYSYCPACAADKKKPSWMSSFEKEECKIVFETLSAYGMKFISASDAKSAIKDIDTSSMNLNEQKKETIKEILGNKSSVKKTPVVEVEEITEAPTPIDKGVEETVEAVTEPVLETKEEIAEPVFGYKKRNKYNEKMISE